MDKLRVSYNNLINLILAYQQTIKEARNSYFSDLMSRNCHNPRALFRAINSAVDPPPSWPVEAPSEKCEQFIHFINIIDNIRLHISPVKKFADQQWSLFSSNFHVISMLELEEFTHHLNSSTCHKILWGQSALKYLSSCCRSSPSPEETITWPSCFQLF